MRWYIKPSFDGVFTQQYLYQKLLESDNYCWKYRWWFGGILFLRQCSLIFTREKSGWVSPCGVNNAIILMNVLATDVFRTERRSSLPKIVRRLRRSRDVASRTQWLRFLARARDDSAVFLSFCSNCSCRRYGCLERFCGVWADECGVS